jgi:hypothetical protein
MRNIPKILLNFLSSTPLRHIPLGEDEVLAKSSALNVLTFFLITTSASNLFEIGYNALRTLSSCTGIVAQDFYKNHAMGFFALTNMFIALYYFANANPAMGLFFLFDTTSCLITKGLPKDGYKWSAFLDLASSTSLFASNPIAGIISLTADLISINALPEFKNAVANLFLAAELTFNKPDIKITNPIVSASLKKPKH